MLEHGGHCELGELKTTKARRQVHLPAIAVEGLRRHRASLGAVPHPGRLIFTDTRGGPLRKPNLLRRSFRPLLKRAGLPLITFHALRHSAASIMMAVGVHR